MRLAIAVVVALVAACGPGSFNVPPPGRSGTELPPGAVRPSETPSATPSPGSTARPTGSPGAVTLKEFPVPAGSGPHDVAPAADGGVWYTAQRAGKLGWLDPKTGQTREIPLGPGSAPHGVIVDAFGVAWVTDSGQNAIVSVDPRANDKVAVWKIPGSNVNLNTAVFDAVGTIWFTGQGGAIGRIRGALPSDVAPMIEVIPAPRGAGPYGITAQPGRLAGVDAGYPGVFYASLAGDHIARIVVRAEGTASRLSAEPIDPPTKGAGPRRVWADSKGDIWVSEWNVGQLGRYDPGKNEWKEWKLPGTRPQAYAVFVDDRDIVWLTEWSASAIVRFDPATERFDVFPHAPGGSVRQLHGRPGEVWGALSALDKLLLVTTR